MAIKGIKRKVVIEQEGSDEEEELNENSSSGSEINENESYDELESDKEAIEDNEDDITTTNLGWADSVSKILKTTKPKGKKSLVLSRAKKLTDLHRVKTTSAGFEIETTDGEIKQEQIETTVSSDDKPEQPQRKRKKEITSVRVKPDILQKNHEHTLTKIATRGVVQLFNAVKKQQKDINSKLEKAGPLEVKRDKVLKSIDKRQFLNVLMGEKSQTKETSTSINDTLNSENKHSNNESTWSVLRDDFMMGGKMKDWNKELENEVEQETIESE